MRLTDFLLAKRTLAWTRAAAILLLLAGLIGTAGAQGKRLPPEIQQTYDAMFKKARSDNKDLYEKLDEYRKGKRDHRDAYIILRKIWRNYKTLREDQGSKARAVFNELRALQKEHPELKSLGTDKLSEEREKEAREQAQLERSRREAAEWTPQDAVPLREYQRGNRSAKVFQYRMEFFSDSDSEPNKTISSKYRFLVHPHPRMWNREPGDNFLICSNMFGAYSPQTDHEKKMALHRGHSGSGMPWVNKRGRYKLFCGIANMKGKIIFKFPLQKDPGRLFYPLGIAGAGKRAAVLVGERTKVEYEGVFYDGPGNYREVWVWEHPRNLRKLPITQDDLKGNNLLRKLRDGTL